MRGFRERGGVISPRTTRADRLGRFVLEVGHRGVAREYAVEDRAEAVDVRGRAQLVELPRRLLGAHVRRRTDETPRQRRRRPGPRGRGEGDAAGLGPARVALAGGPGQAPVDDQGLAEPPQHHVVRLQVAVQHAAAVGVGDDLADGDEPAQQPAELDRRRVGPGMPLVIGLDDLDEAVVAQEPHGVKRAAIVGDAQAVDWDDPGVLEAAGDLGLDHKPRPQVVAIPVGPDLLEGDVAAELLVARNEHLAQPAASVEPEDAEPGATARAGHGECLPVRGERGIDHSGRLGEPRAVLVRPGRLPPRRARLQLQRQEVAEQPVAERLGRLPQLVLDRSRTARLPVHLEPVTDRDEAVEVGHRERAVGGRVGHGSMLSSVPPADHAETGASCCHCR